jgi:hypothetical protein
VLGIALTPVLQEDFVPEAPRASVSTLLAGAGLACAGAVAYRVVVRPWFLRWGATEAEVSRPWPGDELVERPRARAVRAVTIDARPDKIWPWIMQVGRDRGGFYSYTWLENLIGADIHNVHFLIPGLAERRAGETVWMAPENRFGGQGRMVVGRVTPERAMVLVMPGDADQVLKGGSAREGVWSFVLDPVSDRQTRLVMVTVGPGTLGLSRGVADRLFWEPAHFIPAHFIMERRMMLTIKRLAEGWADRV